MKQVTGTTDEVERNFLFTEADLRLRKSLRTIGCGLSRASLVAGRFGILIWWSKVTRGAGNCIFGPPLLYF